MYMVLFSFPFTFLLVLMYGFGMLIFCLLRLICQVMLCFVMLCFACFAFLLSCCFHVLFSVIILYCLFHFQGMANCDFSILKL